MNPIFIDTNILLRYLTGDDPIKYERCRDLFKRVLEKKILLLTSDMVIAELIWTLHSFYNVSKEEIIEKVTIMINTPNLKILNKKLLSEALVLFSQENIDYIDAYNAVFMKNKGCTQIFSYDKDFDCIEDIKRMEP
ncbi:MAG: PIN domain-containing protein [Candidatus Aminicenantes bacterium]|nr:MAG: PIN domain-containing protein [Candidatus Aminicenantes bacterium]